MPFREPLAAKVKVEDGLLKLEAPDALTGLPRRHLEDAVAIANGMLRTGVLSIDKLQLDPVVFSPDEGAEKAYHPCNWNGVTWHWWGACVYMSRDFAWDLAFGGLVHVGAEAVAVQLGLISNPYGIAIALVLFAQAFIITTQLGNCGVKVDVTWAGICKKIARRDD